MMEFKVYKGKQGIKDIMNEFSAIQKTGDVIYSFGYEGGFDKVLGKDWWKTITRVKSANTKFKGVFSLHPAASRPHTKRTEIKYVKAGKGEIEVAVWKDTVRIFSLTKKNPYVVLIKDPAVAKGLMNYWKLLHGIGKEAKKKL